MMPGMANEPKQAPLGGTGEAKTEAAAKKPAGAALADSIIGEIQWYELEAPITIPRGGGSFTIPVGEQIHDGPYNVADLKRRGAKLKEIEAPAWWVEAQRQGTSLRPAAPASASLSGRGRRL